MDGFEILGVGGGKTAEGNDFQAKVWKGKGLERGVKMKKRGNLEKGGRKGTNRLRQSKVDQELVKKKTNHGKSE